METELVYGRTSLPMLNVSSFTMLQIPSYARAMDFLSGNLASFPIVVYQHDVKIGEDHDLDPILSRRANQMQSAFAFWRQWYLDGENRGNGYAYIRRETPTSPVITGLYNLSPDDVTPFRLIPEGGDIFDAQLYYWHVPTKRPIPAADVLHYKPGLCYDGLVGYAPYQLFATTFQRAQALQIFMTKYTLKGSVVKASIEVPVGTSKDQQKEIVAAMRQFRADEADKDLILLTGGATMKSQTGTSQQMQLIEQDEAITKKIAQITGVPQQFLMDSVDQKYNAASVEALGQDVIRFCFRTRIENIEDVLTLALLSEDEIEAGYTIHLDTSALIRGDTAVEMTVATQGVAGGLLTRNEGRTQIGEQPVADPAADKLLVPSHVATESESPSQAESETHAAAPPQDQYEAFKPLIEAAAERVEAKATKALETAGKKPDAERITYTNVLAESQGSYAAESLAPIAETMKALGAATLDVSKIAERYSNEIRSRAAGNERKELIAIVGEVHAAA
jgi:HK97 family phage portal protein